MSTTVSGRLLLPRNFGVPLLSDIAIQSGRLVRWGGSCTIHWTVLHHLFVCSTLVEEMKAIGMSLGGIRFGAEAELIALLHDAEEIATNDVPSQWKSKEFREQADALQSRIYATFLCRQPTSTERVMNKSIDLLALVAEARSVCPPAAIVASGLDCYVCPWGEQWVARAVEIVKQVHGAAPSWVHTMDGLNSTLVLWYLRELERFGVWNAFGENLRPPVPMAAQVGQVGAALAPK
jgi:hypothetical protein